MAIKAKRVSLSPPSRKTYSTYQINTKDIHKDDTLLVRVDEEDTPGRDLFAYEFRGIDVMNRDRIHFRAKHTYKGWEIIWVEVRPLRSIDKSKE